MEVDEACNDLLRSEIETSQESLPLNSTKGASDSYSIPAPMPLLNGIFFKYVPEKSTKKTFIGLCMKCLPQKKEIKGYIKCTSNFLSHLRRIHGPEAIQQYREYMQNNGTKSRVNYDSVNVNNNAGNSKHVILQKEFLDDLAKYFIHSMIPLRTVEDPYFKKLFENLSISDQSLKIPNRRSLRNAILKRSFEQESEVKEKLTSAKYVCITTDIWSGKKRSFLGVTAHWISAYLQRQSVALACRRFKGSHTHDRIKDILLEVYSEFNLDVSKIVASVTDNGANFVKAFKIFGIETKSLELETDVSLGFETSDAEDECESAPIDKDPSIEKNSQTVTNKSTYNNIDNNLLSPHLRCCAHTLNLTASADIKDLLNDNKTALGRLHLEVIRKCNALWNAAGRPKSAEIIQSILGHTLSRPGPTRWNSFYDSLKQISAIRNKNFILSRALGHKNPLTNIEYDYIDEFIECAKPIADAIDILQGSNTFYGVVLPCLLALKKNLKKLLKQDLKYCGPVLNKYIDSIEERFSEFYGLSGNVAENAVIAALSYPKFKNKWFSCIPLKKHKWCIRLFTAAICDEISANVKDPFLQNYSTKKSKEDIYFDFGSNSDSECEELDTPKKKVELLISGFFSEQCQEVNLLERYQLIKRVFVKYNTAMPSSGAVERMFSFATMINLSTSQNLSDDMFEKKVVMKNNLNYFKK